MKPYDYIIAGAGASGLTLAYLLTGLEDNKSILIIDKDQKKANDRTWSFWEQGDNLFENLVYKKWSKAVVKGQNFDKTYVLGPYQYKMIRAIDFYNYLVPKIKKSPQVTWVEEEITAIKENGTVLTQSRSHQGQIVFNSCIDYENLQFKGANTLLQHFKGWIIETPDAHFDIEKATYMDFSVDQENDCRFGYVLPFSTNKALIEYTLFNKTLLTKAAYETRLKKYIQSLGIDHFKILEEENGVIPMTDHNFPIKKSKQLYQIGILGGFAKASTGYSFLRAQHILQKMTSNIAQNKGIDTDLPYQKYRFKKYDATLLDVISTGKFTGEDIFVNLFEKNGAHAVFKFLDEQTNIAEELKIMSSTPILDFGSSFIKQMVK